MGTENPALQRQKVIVRTSIIGIVANVALSALKAVIGLAANSIAIVLDAVNNLTDALSSVITILGTKLANRSPDRKHPLGHGRYEYLTAMIIAAIVLYAGITALVESIKKIIEPEVADYSMVTLIIVASAVVVKIVLGIYVQRKGKQVDSGSLIASGKDALFDAVLSASVLAAAIVFITTGIALEAYLGVVIAAVIIKSGIEMLMEALDDILGHRPDAELSSGIKQTVCEDPDVRGAYDLLIENYGPDLVIAQVHVEVDDTMAASQIDAMTRRIQRAVYERHKVLVTTVGIYSFNTGEGPVAEMRAAITRVVMSHEGILQMHGFHVDEENHLGTFDIVMDFEVEDASALCAHIAEEVKGLYPDYTFAIVPDRDLSD